MNIKIVDLAKHAICVASDDGHLVYKHFEAALKNGEEITADFAGVSTLTSAFLNAAIGQLYSQFKSDFIDRHVSVVNLDESDEVLLARVRENAKIYFSDPDRYDASRRAVFGDIDE